MNKAQQIGDRLRKSAAWLAAHLPCWHHTPSCWSALDRADPLWLVTLILSWTLSSHGLRATAGLRATPSNTALSAQSQLQASGVSLSSKSFSLLYGCTKSFHTPWSRGKAWFIRPTWLVLAEWESHTEWFSLFMFFRFISFKCLNKILMEYPLEADQRYSSPVRPFVMVSKG